jgi:hypothetical protein
MNIKLKTMKNNIKYTNGKLTLIANDYFGNQNDKQYELKLFNKNKLVYITDLLNQAEAARIINDYNNIELAARIN